MALRQMRVSGRMRSLRSFARAVQGRGADDLLRVLRHES
jgi:hypothetical protein